MKAFLCDKCGNSFRRKRRALQKEISFDGERGPRTLVVDLLYRCVHLKQPAPTRDWYDHGVEFCDDCLIWLLEEYKGSIMVAVGREVDVTEDARECVSNQA